MSKRKSKQNETPPTVITLTLPTPEGGGIAPERATATLLIQRGELAQVRQFHYHRLPDDLVDIIGQYIFKLLQTTVCPLFPDLHRHW